MDASRPPMLEHGDVETQNLAELAQYLSALSTAGAIMFPDEALERHLRLVAGFPPPPEEQELPEEPPPVPPSDTPEIQDARQQAQKSFKKLMELREMMRAAKNNGHVGQ